jgi:hypothetical protein
MSRRRAKEAGRAMSLACRCCMGSSTGDDGSRTSPGLKPDGPLLCPTGCSFPQIFQPEPNKPANIRAQQATSPSRTFLFCFLLLPAARTPLGRVALLYATTPPVCRLLALALSRRPHPHPGRLAPSRPRGSSVVRQQLSCSSASVHPKDHICHKDSGTREPPLLP